MEIQRTTKREVMQRLMALVRKSVPTYENRVYFCVGNEQTPNVRDHEFIVVRAPGGQFDQNVMRGSGPPVAPYSTVVVIEIRRNNRQDRTGTDEISVVEDSGILDVQESIISGLAGSHLELESDRFGTAILTEPLMPVMDSDIERDSNEVDGDSGPGTNSRLVLAMTFTVNFHWKLR